MRITVDTNILISATFWNGASSKIIDMVENKEVDLVLSKDILKEYDEVLNYKEIQDKIKNKNLEMKKSVGKVISISEMVVPQQIFKVIKEDLDDNKIIECAVEGDVDYLVSNDKHLLKLKEFKGIKIIKPEEFLLK